LPSQLLVPAPVMSAPGVAASVPASATSPDENALITTALHKLRTSHEPAAALAVLDEYHLRFPGGEIAPEAARLRAEALLRLGRKSVVLEDLDRSLSGQTPDRSMTWGPVAGARVGIPWGRFRLWTDLRVRRWLHSESVQIDSTSSANGTDAALPSWEGQWSLGVSYVLP
jgi:hypothetical protein